MFTNLRGKRRLIMNFSQEELFLLRQVYKEGLRKRDLILSLDEIEVNEEDTCFLYRLINKIENIVDYNFDEEIIKILDKLEADLIDSDDEPVVWVIN